MLAFANGSSERARNASCARDRLRLLPQVQLLDHTLVAIVFRPAQVIEKAPARGDHLEEAAARGMIFGVTLQVFGQLRDPAGQKCHLHIRAAGIFLVELELLHVLRVTAFCHKRRPSVDDVSRLASRRDKTDYQNGLRLPALPHQTARVEMSFFELVANCPGGAVSLLPALAPLASRAVILFRTADPAANTTAPTGGLSGSGWQFEGLWGSFLGTPIAPHFFLSAKHVGQAGGIVQFRRRRLHAGAGVRRSRQ